MLNLFVSTFIKFFFLLTPFFVLSTFLSMTVDLPSPQRKKLAIRVTVAVFIICLAIFSVGNAVFAVFGITLDAFRVGTGVLLMLSAISLVRGITAVPQSDDEDLAVVPLAIPVTVGPATTGALLVMGGELHTFEEIAFSLTGIACAVLVVGVLLFVSGFFERIVKRQGLMILSKVTGLILAALAAQLVMNGVAGFLKTLAR